MGGWHSNSTQMQSLSHTVWPHLAGAWIWTLFWKQSVRFLPSSARLKSWRLRTIVWNQRIRAAAAGCLRRCPSPRRTPLWQCPSTASAWLSPPALVGVYMRPCMQVATFSVLDSRFPLGNTWCLPRHAVRWQWWWQYTQRGSPCQDHGQPGRRR